MSATFDGIILGTGHNALILQAYLSRCGLRTLSLDRAAIPGGGLMTIDNPRLPGFRHNPHSFFHRAATAMPWYRDLELEQHGVHYLEPKLNVAMILSDGRALEWWTDLDRTVASCAEFSKRDAETVRRMAEEFGPVVEKILRPEAQSPPLEPGLRRRLLERSALGRRLLQISALSPLEFVTQHFEDDARPCLIRRRRLPAGTPLFSGRNFPTLCVATHRTGRKRNRLTARGCSSYGRSGRRI